MDEYDKPNKQRRGILSDAIMFASKKKIPPVLCHVPIRAQPVPELCS